MPRKQRAGTGGATTGTHKGKRRYGAGNRGGGAGNRAAQLTQGRRGTSSPALRNLTHNELVNMVSDQSQMIATQAQIIANL